MSTGVRADTTRDSSTISVRETSKSLRNLWSSYATPLDTGKETAMFRLDVPAKDSSDKRQPHQLLPGRHGLPRSFVVSNQRERILSAVAYVTSAASYSEMSVEAIMVPAGAARRSFHGHFKNNYTA